MIRIARKIIFIFLLFVGTGFVFFTGHLLTSGRDAAVIMYHSVGEKLPAGDMLNISQEAFEAQMDFLARRGYRVITLLGLVDILENKKKIPAKTVVITFDDGYESTYTKVFPVLKKYNFPATVFIVPNFLGQARSFGGRVFRFMTPAMLQEMAASGLVTVGSHTMNHPYLPDIADRAVLREEIAGSKKALEKLTGRPVEVFCYPVGGYTPRVQDVVRKAGYRAAVTTLPRHKGFAHADLFALKRIKMTERSRGAFILTVQFSGYYLRMKEM